MENRKDITIPFEEYKELLMIKGRYEELKELHQPPIIIKGDEVGFSSDPPYKVTCVEG